MIDAKHLITALALTTPSTLTVEVAMTDTGTLKPHEFIGVLLNLSAEDVKVMRLTKTATQFHPSSSAQEEPNEEYQEESNKNELEQLQTTG